MAEILVTQYPGSLDAAKAVGLLAYGQRQIKSELTAKHGAGEGGRSATGGSWAKAFVAAQFDSDDPPLVNADLVAEVYTETRFDWRSELENSVTRLRAALAAAGEDTSAFDAVDWCDSYSGIRASLCELQSRYRKAVVRQAGALDDHAHHKVEVIKRECDNPNFGVCLPIIGEWGSGRTRLLVELARTHYRRGQWPILLGPGDEAVIDRLLDRASTLFGFAINEVRELADAINAVDKDVLICIDDVDRLSATELGHLRETVSALTMCPRLRWVITADILRYDALTVDGLAGFWPAYGLRLRGGVQASWYLAGWLNLTAVNGAKRTGMRILERDAGPGRLQELVALSNDPLVFADVVSLLNNPLPAWIQLDSLASSNEFVGNVWRRPFIAEYWAKLCAAAAVDVGDETAVEDLVTLWSRYVFQPSDRGIPVRDLIAVSAEELQDQGISSSDVRRILYSLRDFGVVTIVREGDPAIAPVTEMLSPSLDVLWGYRIARVVLADTGAAAVEGRETSAALQRWGSFASRGDGLAEAVTQFGLSLLPWGTEQEAETSFRIWSDWLFTDDLSDLPLQLASTSAPVRGEEIVIEGLSGARRGRQRSKREVFVLLRFTLLARSTTWSADRRLSAMRPYFGAIGAGGLGHYAAYVVRNILERNDITRPDRILECLSSLRGTEDAGFAATAAEAVLGAMSRINNNDLVASLQQLSRWLFRTDRMTLFPPRPPVADRRPLDVDVALGMRPEGGVYCFWEHLIQRICRKAVLEWRWDAIRQLDQLGWLKPPTPDAGPVKAVRDRIDDELNVAVGNQYLDNHSDRQERREFLDLVSKLVAGTAISTSIADQRVRAFFIIRHTEITGREPGVRVDDSFHDALTTICGDPDPQVHGRISPWKQPMMAANGLA